ncbi:MAG TPA: sarcosine oxidase subunit gamma family protein [Steroidobacteraceae bacterium]|nr:sarcosine oxidase subunit gamma family protein [Steroidobacteraceae bacterium]
MLEVSSPLDARLAGGGRDGADGRRTLRLTEIRDGHLVQLGVFAGGAGVIAPIVEALTGAPLPLASSEVTVSGAHRLYRIAVDQYWIVSDDAALAQALERKIPADAASVTVLSSARIRIGLEGAAAQAVLAHHVALDLDESQFPEGRFAQSGIDHAGVLLERRGRDRFELFVLRTFAASTFDVLIDTALPYGYELGIEAVGITSP